MMKFALIILGILYVSHLSESYSIQPRSYKVFRGQEIRDWKKNIFKFVVILLGKSVCSGSIYSGLSIVTASHCFTEPGSIKFVALEFVGYGARIRASQTIPVARINLNPAYTKISKEWEVNGFDVATVQLERSIPFNKFDVTLVDFWNHNEIPFNIEVFVVGYGKDSSKNEGPGNLKWGNQIYVKCPNRGIPGSPLCVRIAKRYNGENTEGGDSGGPLLKALPGKTFLVMGTLSGEINYNDGVSVGLYGSTKLNWRFIQGHVKE